MFKKDQFWDNSSSKCPTELATKVFKVDISGCPFGFRGYVTLKINFADSPFKGTLKGRKLFDKRETDTKF